MREASARDASGCSRNSGSPVTASSWCRYNGRAAQPFARDLSSPRSPAAQATAAPRNPSRAAPQTVPAVITSVGADELKSVFPLISSRFHASNGIKNASPNSAIASANLSPMLLVAAGSEQSSCCSPYGVQIARRHSFTNCATRSGVSISPRAFTNAKSGSGTLNSFNVRAIRSSSSSSSAIPYTRPKLSSG